MRIRLNVFTAVVAAGALLSARGAARADLGVPISDPRPVNTNASVDNGLDLAPSIATDGQGNWIAVWTSTNSASGVPGDSDIFFARSIDNGENWSVPSPLNTNANTDSGIDSNPRIATDRLGHWVVVWHSSDTLGGTIGGEFNILVSRSSNNGANWSPPAALNSNSTVRPYRDVSAHIAADGVGHWIAVWMSNDPLGTTGIDFDIFFARSIDNGEHWSPAAPLNANAGANGVVDEGEPFVAMNSQGIAVAAWSSKDTLGSTIGTDLDILVARSLDGGLNWSVPIPLNTNASFDAIRDSSPSLALDDQGHCAAVWSSRARPGFPDNGNSYILTARSLDNGANWSFPAVLNANASGISGTELSPRIITDGRGRWVVAWTNDLIFVTANSDADLLIVESDDDGANWTFPGVLNTNAGQDDGGDNFVDLATDDAGNWVAVWSSNDSLGGTIGIDPDCLSARFARPDCNSNLIADAAETAAGLATDVNGNSIPDACESFSADPPPGGGGIGAGLCGGGTAAFAPISLVGIACMGLAFRRQYS